MIQDAGHHCIPSVTLRCFQAVQANHRIYIHDGNQEQLLGGQTCEHNWHTCMPEAHICGACRRPDVTILHLHPTL